MDLAIRNALIVDGTGSPGYRGDIGIEDGKIIAVGVVEGHAREEIDAGGAVVAPGFIDCHTHYDAQISWDATLSPSIYHGVTTVLGGHCGFTLAPLSGRQSDADYLLAMLSKVEGMPLPVLEAAVNPTWRSFGEFLDMVDGKVVINAAFSVGHSALRRYVMGDRAVGHEATADEIAQMVALLRRSLDEGGVGFSTTISASHSDHNGDPVPSRWANEAELLALAGVLRDYPGTWIEVLPGAGALFDEPQWKFCTDMALAAEKPLNWNLLHIDSSYYEFAERQLKTSDYARERGATVYALVPTVPLKMVLNFRSGITLEMLEEWPDFLQLADAAKIEAMRDPDMRARLRTAMETSTRFIGYKADFTDFTIVDAKLAHNAKWVGRTVGAYAAAARKTPFDAIFDLAIEEELKLSFSPPEVGADAESWRLRGMAWQDDRCLVGASDAGAHLDLLNTFAFSTQLLGEGVRKRGLLSMEEGVRLLTSRIADAFGLKGRGRLATGYAADLVVFNPDTVDCAPLTMREDLPAGEARLYADAVGVDHVIVGGVRVAGDNKVTGLRGGKVLRRMADTAPVQKLTVAA